VPAPAAVGQIGDAGAIRAPVSPSF